MYYSQTDQALIKIEVGRVINDSKLIAGIIRRDKACKEKRMMREGVNYYLGENDIKNKNFQIYHFQGKTKTNPNRANNKVSDAFFTDLVDQKKDYIIGQEPTINFKVDVFKKDYSVQFKEKFYDMLDEIVVNTSNKGEEWLHLFVNEDGDYDFIITEAEGIVPDYDERNKNNLLSLLRYYIVDYIDDKGELKQRTKVEIWDKEKVWFYIEIEKDKFVLDASENPNPRPHWLEQQKIGEVVVDEEIKNFGFVPFINLPNNKLKINDLKRIKSLIDLYDLILSGFGNEVEDHREIVIKIKNYDGQNNEELVQMLKESGVIKVKGDGDAEALTLLIPVEAKKTVLEILKESIYRFGRGIDYSGLAINQPTNLTLKFMFAGLDLKANALIRQLSKFIKSFFTAYARYLGIDFDTANLEIVFNKSLIFNESERITDVQNSSNTVSKKTQLSNHPWVKDVDAELKQIEEEESGYVDLNEPEEK